jgi:nucleoid DNA-binding protein
VTRKDIIRVISEELGFAQLQTRQIVQNLFDTIINTLAEEGRVELRNFGVFEVKWRKARKAHNPHTGELVMVPRRCTVVFKPGQALAERVKLEGRTADVSCRPETRSLVSARLGD